jgi:hypothetical protein
MSKAIISGTIAVPVSPGSTLATLFGYTDQGTLFDGIVVAPDSNSGNLTVVKTTPSGSDVTLAPGQSTPRKIFTLGSFTVYSANGTDTVVLDGTGIVRNAMGPTYD